MNIALINHASLFIEGGGVSLLCDPWYDGAAFNNGWDLIVAHRITPDELRRVTHIWYSHEHPDHFAPGFLKSIPPDRRADITVIFQKTRDGKVLQFAAKNGYKTQELPFGQPTDLGGMTVVCGEVPIYDSWLFITADGQRLFNMNDCDIKAPAELSALARQVGSVDILSTQFSYASWKGNRQDRELREVFAREKLRAMQAQIEILKPKHVIPFASMIYFSHVENRHLNDAMNTVAQAADAISAAGATPVVLFPGDRWTTPVAWDNTRALERYEEAFQLDGKPYRESPSIAPAALEQSFATFQARLKQKNSWWLMRVASRVPMLQLFQDLDVFVPDHDTVYRLNLFRGLRNLGKSAPFDVKMHSDCLNFLLANEYGFDTLTVNGRFESDLPQFGKMLKCLGVSALNNAGRSFSPRLMFDVKMLAMMLAAVGRFFTVARAARKHARDAERTMSRSLV